LNRWKVYNVIARCFKGQHKFILIRLISYNKDRRSADIERREKVEMSSIKCRAEFPPSCPARRGRVKIWSRKG
jgi:hypothetical protein